jgi:aspartate-semialdehyde dehydrogenase
MSAHFARPTRHEALDRLADRRLYRELAYVDGHWTAGKAGRGFEVTDPGSGASLAWVASLDAEQAGKAIDAAARAFPAWRAQLPQERAYILRKWFDLILAAKDDLALLMTLEQGKPLKESLGEIDYAASFVEWYAEEAKRLNAESVTSRMPR